MKEFPHDPEREDRPDLADWWLRDFRTQFKTRLRDAGVPRELVKRLQGHAVDVSENYYQAGSGEDKRLL